MKLTLLEIQANPSLANHNTIEQAQELAAIIEEVRNKYHSFYYATSPSGVGLARTPSGVVDDWLTLTHLCLDNYQDQDPNDNRGSNYQASIALPKTKEYLRDTVASHNNLNTLIYTASQLSSIKSIRQLLENARIFDNSLENTNTFRR